MTIVGDVEKQVFVAVASWLIVTRRRQALGQKTTAYSWITAVLADRFEPHTSVFHGTVSGLRQRVRLVSRITVVMLIFVLK